MAVKLGLDAFLEAGARQVAGKRVGLVTSVSGVDANLTSSVERLYLSDKVNLVALFGPEHGLRGEAQAGDHVSMYQDSVTGLPVYSLYGNTLKPTAEMLRDLDVLIYDIQDGGVRFFTFLATLANLMQAAAEFSLPLIVLDRPAPLTGLYIEGPVLDPAFHSFVGPYPIPLRYGMTIGEMARLANETFKVGCDLTVIPLEGWRREMWYDQTGLPFIPPSPNMPTLTALTLFPGTCLIEGTNVSEGRGTSRPFEYIGAPWIKAEQLSDALNALTLPGVRFRPVYFVPTFSKFQGSPCAGVQPYVTDRDVLRPLEVGLHLLTTLKTMYPEQFAWRDSLGSMGRPYIDLLTGTDRVRQQIDAGGSVDDLVQSWQPDLAAFEQLRAQFLLYPIRTGPP